MGKRRKRKRAGEDKRERGEREQNPMRKNARGSRKPGRPLSFRLDSVNI